MIKIIGLKIISKLPKNNTDYIIKNNIMIWFIKLSVIRIYCLILVLINIAICEFKQNALDKL